MEREWSGFRACVRSDAFLVAFNGLDPECRQSAIALVCEGGDFV